MAGSPSIEAIRTALSGVEDPEIHRPITELGMVKDVRVLDHGKVEIAVYLTVSGCPILWPIPVGRKRWYPIGPPKAIRFRAGSWVELKVLMPVFMLLGGVGGAAALNVI